MIIKPGSVIGIVGGGQLGKMTALAAANLGYKVNIYTDNNDSPASYVADKVFIAPYDDEDKLTEFAANIDVVTFEFENIPIRTVDFLADKSLLRPNRNILYIAQNRQREKEFLNSVAIKTANYIIIENLKDLENAVKKIKNSAILKSVESGYDGKGQYPINKDSDLKSIRDKLPAVTYILEEKINFNKEISVIIARNASGVKCYKPAENIHKKGILDHSIIPANITAKLEEKAYKIAEKIAENLNLIGLLAVEFFVTEDDELLVNELAPRPHNSGHWTMDGAVTCQFEQLVRAICNLPLGNVDIKCNITMKNLIGKDINLWSEYIKDPKNKIYIYGKNKAAPGRKMGHVNMIK